MRRQAAKVDATLIIMAAAFLMFAAVIVVAARRGGDRGGGSHPGAKLGTDLVPVGQQRLMMGTVPVRIEVRVLPGEEATAREAIDAAFAAIARIEELASTYDRNSELMRLNLEGAERSVVISEELAECIAAAELWRERTGGAFDASIAPVLRVWRRAERIGVPPSDDEIAAALTHVVDGPIIWSRVGSVTRGQLGKKGVSIDLSGIAKGWAVDLAVAAIRQRGFTSAMVDAGGDVFVLGGRDSRGSPWRFGVKDPRAGRADEHEHEHDREPIAVVAVADRAICTSGDYERYIEVGGRRYSHIIDPRTGRPVQNAASVSVIAPDATSADALATALSVMGPEAGLALVESLPETEALFLSRGEGDRLERAASSGWAAHELELKLRWRKQE